jgi:hypothetical protein
MRAGHTREPLTARTAILATAAALALLAGACSDDTEQAGTARDAPAAAMANDPPPPVAPAEPRTPAGPQDPSEPPARPAPVPDRSAPDPCDAATSRDITATVSAQLEAFAAGDLRAAYALTSPFFTTLVDEARFEELIRSDYPLLLVSRERWTGDCLVRGRRGVLLAGVADAAGRELVLRYDLSLEDVGWRIDGALRVDGITLPRPPVI